MIEEVAGGSAWVLALPLRNPGDGKAQRESAQHAKDEGGLGGAHPGAVLIKSFIQAAVEVAFDAPVFAFDLLEFGGASLLRIQAADEVHGLVAHPARAQYPPLDANDLTGGGEAGLRGIGRLAAGDGAQLHAPTIEFPIGGRGARCFTRGKRAALPAACRDFREGFFGCP